MSKPKILWDTLIDDDVATLGQPVHSEVASSSDNQHHDASAQALPEISSGLLELAARIKALEACEPPAILEPESNDFRAAVFSDVLAAAAATGADTQKATAHPATPLHTPHSAVLSVGPAVGRSVRAAGQHRGHVMQLVVGEMQLLQLPESAESLDGLCFESAEGLDGLCFAGRAASVSFSASRPCSIRRTQSPRRRPAAPWCPRPAA